MYFKKEFSFLTVILFMHAACDKKEVEQPKIAAPAAKISILASFLSDPRDVTLDKAGNLYVTESYTSNITRIAPDLTKTTFAGIGRGDFKDGMGTTAAFYTPGGLVTDSNGNMFVCDSGNSAIRKITPDRKVTTVLSSGTPLHQPLAITIDNTGNLFIINGLNRVVKITQAGVASLFAGGIWGSIDGTGVNAGFENPNSITFDSFSGNLFVVDGSGLVRKINPAGKVSTIQGFRTTSLGQNGSTVSWAQSIWGITGDGTGNIFVADYYGRRIISIGPNDSISEVYKISGYTFNALISDKAGNLYALDNANGFRNGFLYKISFHK